MSRKIKDAPVTAPFSSRRGEVVSETAIDVPSLRTRVVAELVTDLPALVLARMKIISPVRSLGMSRPMDLPTIFVPRARW